MLYGRNITDEITATGAADVPLADGSHWEYMEQGETWGARTGSGTKEVGSKVVIEKIDGVTLIVS
jgi:membrane protein implicated in regulation of membrane protease activity